MDNADAIRINIRETVWFAIAPLSFRQRRLKWRPASSRWLLRQPSGNALPARRPDSIAGLRFTGK
jgi:hypothetical protein